MKTPTNAEKYAVRVLLQDILMKAGHLSTLAHLIEDKKLEEKAMEWQSESGNVLAEIFRDLNMDIKE